MSIKPKVIRIFFVFVFTCDVLLAEYGRQVKYTFVDSLFGGYLMSTVTCEECKNVRQGNWLKVTLKQVDLDLGSGITLFYVIMCKILGRNQKRSIDLIMIFNKARGIFHLIIKLQNLFITSVRAY